MHIPNLALAAKPGHRQAPGPAGPVLVNPAGRASAAPVARARYALVRHPVYAAYIIIQSGYLLQSISLRNAAVVAFATCCNVGRAVAEERLLSSSAAYQDYGRRVRWRLVPGVW